MLSSRRETIMIKEYKLKDGSTRYLIQVYRGIDERGKARKTTRRGFKTEREAKIAEARLMNTPLESPKDKTFNDVFELWSEQYENQVRESTYHKTMTIFRLHIIPIIGSKRIHEITAFEIQELVNDWSKNFVKYRVMARYMNKVFKKAIKMDLITVSPLDKIDMPAPQKKIEKRSANFYDKDQLTTFLEGMITHAGIKWASLFRLLAFSGMRQGELLALTWSDIDFVNATVDINKALTRGIGNRQIIQPPKSESSIRCISIDKGTIDLLKDWKLEQSKILLMTGKRSDNQLVFPADSTNKFLTSSQLRSNIKKVQQLTGLPEITVHGLRHTHCSLLFEAGMTMEVVKERLGHSDIATTMNIYTHVTQKRQDETANIFANFMENQG